MAAKPKSQQPPDELTQRLQASLRQGRPRYWRNLLFVCLPLALLLGFLLWLAYPRPEPPPLKVVGLDALISSDETPALRARLEPEDPDAANPQVEGVELWFLDPPGRADRQEVKAATDANGEAAPQWTMATDPTRAFFHVRRIGDKRQPASDDHARLFRWPADVKLLVLDVGETLLGKEAVAPGKALDLTPPKEAAKALQAAAKNHRLVYLASQPPRALDYLRWRGWIDYMTAAGGFPEGPVLGRRSFAQASADQARLDLLQDLRRRFKGPLLVLVGKPETAEQLRQHGITPLLLNEAPAAGEIAHLKTWADLPAALGK